MTVLVIVHQILNRKWYGALFKGRYRSYRTLTTAVNILLLLSFALTAFCGMSMSGHAVPFLYGMAPVSFARRMHLSMSHWSFVLMGLHLGLHIPAMTAKMQLGGRKKTLVSAVFCCIAGIGLWFFLRNDMTDYLLFRVPFAFLDYEKAGVLVILENLIMLLFWTFTGTQLSLLCMISGSTEDEKKTSFPFMLIMAAVIIGLVLNTVFADNDENDTGDWGGATCFSTIAC